jgi:hypothetical protein
MFERIRDDDCDRLVAVVDLVVLQQRQMASRRRRERGAPAVRQTRRVLIRHHEQHAGQRCRATRIDRLNRAARNRARDEHAMRKTRFGKLGRIARFARDFQQTVGAVQWMTDHRAHAKPPTRPAA